MVALEEEAEAPASLGLFGARCCFWAEDAEPEVEELAGGLELLALGEVGEYEGLVGEYEGLVGEYDAGAVECWGSSFVFFAGSNGLPSENALNFSFCSSHSCLFV